MSQASTIDEWRNDQWERLKDFIPGEGKGKRGLGSDNAVS
jgi:hypothetical protein